MGGGRREDGSGRRERRAKKVRWMKEGGILAWMKQVVGIN